FFALGLRQGNAEPKQLDAYLAANADGTWLYDFDRIGLLPSFRGRMPDPKRTDEVIATTQQARLLHVGIGGVLHLDVAKFDDPSASAPSSFTPTTLHVVGIATTPVGLLRGGNNTETLLFGTPAFARRFADDTLGSTVYVQLHHPDDLLAFERQATRLTPGLTVEIKPASQELSTFARVASPYTTTLWLFALVAGIAMVLIVAQALVRMVRTDAGSGPELRALGITSGGRSTIAAGRAIAAVLVGLVVAVGVAIAASPVFPLGLVHRVEPDPGVRIDATALGVGALIIGGCLLAVIAVVSRLATRPTSNADADRDGRPSRLASALARMNAPVSIVGGTRLAFRRRRGSASASTAASIFGLVAAIAATSAALVFGANLAQLTTPQRYGQTWDAEIVSSGPSTISPADTQRTLVGHSLATGITSGTFGDVKLDGQVVPSYGLHRRRGNAMPVATKGRLAEHADEVAMGARTLRQLHRSVGDTLTATGSNGKRERLRIVGQTLLPSLNSNTPTVGADDGAQLTRQGLARLNPDLGNEVDFLLVDLAPHTTLLDLRRVFDPNEFTVTGAVAPGYIASYGDVQSTPLILAGLLTLLGIGVLTHLLVTSVRSSRRELAVLKTLGCTRGQLMIMVVWQALALVLVALAAGLVAGVLLGRGAWIRFATGLGMASTVDIPTLQIVAIVLVGLVSAALIAWAPARAATRILPAQALRTE
ncbi:MAG: FtsX-like permease family protein, partial [Acidimicrobiia bacterium]